MLTKVTTKKRYTRVHPFTTSKHNCAFVIAQELGPACVYDFLDGKGSSTGCDLHGHRFVSFLC